MGLLRTLLALIVVLAHAYGPAFIGSQNAVKLFFMISGFLISYILIEKKSYPQRHLFYLNRFLRLYPIYAVVAFLTLSLLVAQSVLLHHSSQTFVVFGEVPFPAQMLLIFSNAFIVLQDVVMFLGVKANHLMFVQDYTQSEVRLYQGLLVPQAWTLSLELMFYLIAPFILPRQKLLIALLCASLAVRGYLMATGLTNDPWSYRFFPAELAYFLLGALSHQCLLPRYRKYFTPHQLKVFAHSATMLLVGFILFYVAIPADMIMKDALLFGLCFACLPLLFIYQTQHRWDAWIADLSYPIYIGHILIISVVHAVLSLLSLHHPMLFIGCVLVVSVVFAVVLNYTIAQPIEDLRQRYKRSIKAR